HARRARRRREAATGTRGPALSRCRRPQHHEDRRDHGPGPRVGDLRDARGGRVEAGRRLPTELVALRPVLAPAALLVLVAALAAGCGAVGRVGQGDVAHGKELFLASTSKGSCAGCHTLADAKAQGTIGPNLDDAFSSDKTQGFSEQTMADIVRGQIAYPEAPMPANLYRGQDARDIALYVAKCAGNANCGVTAETAHPAAGGNPGSPSGGSASSGAPQGAPKPDGKQVFTSAGCAGCHTLKD